MDDWEQFFREKSIRRARRARFRALIAAGLWTATVGAMIAGAMAAVMSR